MKLSLSKRLSRDSAANPFDVQQVKKALNRLGYYMPPEKIGITGTSDAALFDAVKAFQSDHDLKPDGIIRPGGETERILAHESAITPEGFFIWRTVGDDRVRGAHAALEGEIRSWGDSPDPGEDYNCRCWAEPIDLAEYLNTIDPPIEKVYPVETILMSGAALARPLAQAYRIRRFLYEKRDLNWKFGSHKSETKWNNQLKARGWTKQKVTQTIKYGKKYPAPNNVNPNNRAIRYEYQKKFIVRDEVTKEVLQVSGKNEFMPLEIKK